MDSSHEQQQQQEQAPIGTTAMNTEVLKEPRGFIRILEWFFALIAFATVANFSTSCGYTVTCTNLNKPITITHQVFYPFQLDHGKADIENPNGGNTSACFEEKKAHFQPGDFSSDAEFFVFTGVIAWLGASACLVIYVFFSPMYLDDSKKAPMFDFVFTVIIAVFWLSASAAWANGVIGLKSATDDSTWIHGSKFSPCQKGANGAYINSNIQECDREEDQTGSFGGANASVILGFLNFFLWASNLWFIYKETSHFANRSQANNPPQQMES